MNCENDYLEIREAYVKEPITRPVDLAGEYGAILSKPVCGTNNPGTIQSAGNMVWVHFKSDGNATTTYRGFKASFKAGMYKYYVLGRIKCFSSVYLALCVPVEFPCELERLFGDRNHANYTLL